MKARRMSRRTSVASSQHGSDRIYLHLFSKPLAVPSGHPGSAFAPPTDVYETSSHVVVRIEVAGADQDRMQVSFDPPSGQLKVRGLRADPTAGTQREYHQLEVVYGPFERIIEVLVPVEDDQVRADYRDGLLHIYLPKKPPQRPTELSVDIE